MRNVCLILSLKGGMIVVSAIDIICVAIAIGIIGLMASQMTDIDLLQIVVIANCLMAIVGGVFALLCYRGTRNL